MKKPSLFSCLSLAAALAMPAHGLAQASAHPAALHVVKPTINADSANAELCLEFDKALAPMPRARLVSLLHLGENGHAVAPQNIAVSTSALCLFPLDRERPYRLSLYGLRGAQGERMAAPYKLSFVIPDRSPLLSFNGARGFDTYSEPMTLRAVNVARATLEVYRITDPSTMAHIWQTRAETAIAPSESAHLARTKGALAWKGHVVFASARNEAAERMISLREEIPKLAPGLYLILAEASGGAGNKGLAPMAAAWFTKSNFSLRAWRDDQGVHVVATAAATSDSGVRLTAFDRKPESVAHARGGGDGIGLLPLPDASKAATVVGLDEAGNVAFADIETLPALTAQPALGKIEMRAPFAAPGMPVDAVLSLAGGASATIQGALRLTRDTEKPYAVYPVSVSGKSAADISFPAPVIQGLWTMRWQSKDGATMAAARFRVTANPDAPHLSLAVSAGTLGKPGTAQAIVTAVTVSDAPAPLIQGQVMAVWQRRDPVSPAWKGYSFGTQTAVMDVPVRVAAFLTDLHGQAQMRLALPKPPTAPGFYRAELTAAADPGQGVADAPAVTFPLRSDATVIGIKPLAAHARFAQNGLARLALVALSPNEKPRDISGLSYQIYEEGRNFDWYQADGRWSYKPLPLLRPIGGGALTIREDGSSVLEWPVTSGNYRLEIRDGNGKILAQTEFSAGWDSVIAPPPATPLPVSIPAILTRGHKTAAH
ncbi:MAG: hypothetical protein KGI97_07045, partial [Alphaproteobacteria bacterium]|nr:hypothetical protein [Alphaproteobacteria bacterium]